MSENEICSLLAKLAVLLHKHGSKGKAVKTFISKYDDDLEFQELADIAVSLKRCFEVVGDKRYSSSVLPVKKPKSSLKRKQKRR